jgi:hypothetical protein
MPQIKLNPNSVLHMLAEAACLAVIFAVVVFFAIAM